MAGMNRFSGQTLDGWDHVHQSIIDIVTTPIGTRVMRRDYGCDLRPLIDSPGTPQSVAAITMAIVVALARWEPRYRITSVKIVSASQTGVFELNMAGIYFPKGHLGDFETVETDRQVRVLM